MWGMISSSHCSFQTISPSLSSLPIGSRPSWRQLHLMRCDQGRCGPTAGLFLGSPASHTPTQDDVTANQVSVLVADGVGGFFEVTAVGMSFHGTE